MHISPSTLSKLFHNKLFVQFGQLQSVTLAGLYKITEGSVTRTQF